MTKKTSDSMHRNQMRTTVHANTIVGGKETTLTFARGRGTGNGIRECALVVRRQTRHLCEDYCEIGKN